MVLAQFQNICKVNETKQINRKRRIRMTDKNNDNDPAVSMTSLDFRISFANT